METLVLRACINGLIKTLCFLNYRGPGEISWFSRLPGKVSDVGCCNQPLPETQSLWETTVSKYHKCVLKPQKAVQPSWKWMFKMRNAERVCTIYRGINVSWLWTNCESITMPSRFLPSFSLRTEKLIWLFIQFAKEKTAILAFNCIHLASVYSLFWPWYRYDNLGLYFELCTVFSVCVCVCILWAVWQPLR